MTGGRVGDGHGILGVDGSLNAAGIPTMLFNGGPLWVAFTGLIPITDGDPIEYVTLSYSADWSELGGNEDDLAEVYDAVVAALLAGGTPFVPYWGPGNGDTARNVLVLGGSAVTLSLGWPNSDTHG